MEEADIEVIDTAELRKLKCKKVLAERDTARSRPVHTTEPAHSHHRAGPFTLQSRGKSPELEC